MHIFLTAILLGLGAAVPIGPVNIEMMRRTLSFGGMNGMMIGIGASCADMTYITLLVSGTLLFLTNVIVLKVIGVLGAFILAWFGYKSFVSHPQVEMQHLKKQSLSKTFLVGYLMTLFNPMTVLFWASISSQVVSMAVGKNNGIIFAALGVIVGTMSWNIFLNYLLHKIRYKISEKIMRIFNVSGGIILIVFAIVGLIRAFG